MSLTPREPDGPVGSLSLRLATRDDLDALVALENAAFSSDRLSRRSLSRLVGVGSALMLVAELDGRIAASAVVLLRSYSSRARLYSLAVAPHLTGRGIGSSMLSAAEEGAAARGAAALTLEMREDNEAARRLYARRGYRVTGSSPGYYSDGMAALHFVKHLDARGAGAETGRAA